MTNLAEMVTSIKKAESLTDIIARMTMDYPKTMKALRLIDAEYTKPRTPKGYNLVKAENKRTGFAYYVRYMHEGKMLPSKWNTHTNIREEAERFAVRKRKELVERYLAEHDDRTFEILEGFYKEGSEHLLCEEKRSRPLSGESRKGYHRIIKNQFVPFLRNNDITSVGKITEKVLNEYQDYELSTGIKPQTVNCHFKAIKKIFAYLKRKELIKENPCNNLKRLPVLQEDQEARGCYEVEKLDGVFGKEWGDKKLYLLNLLIYSTGLRNSEIERLKLSDIITIEGCRFINIAESKTASGIRMVPLHEAVYKKMTEYAKGKGEDALIFDKSSGDKVYTEAYLALAEKLKVRREELERQNITFYSGRHFFKTLMNSKKLGEDVEEIFMGHKVSSDVSKLYNHRDKQGKKLIAKKARQVYSILDLSILKTKP